MAQINLPNSLSVTGFNAAKNPVANDKAVLPKVQKEQTKLGDAIKTLEAAHGKADLSFTETKGMTSSSEASSALAQLEAFAKGDLKTISTAASSVGSAAEAMSAASLKVAKDRATPPASQKIADKAATAASDAKDAASKFAKELAAAVDAARKELSDVVKKLEAAEKKDAKKDAGGEMTPKAIADGKAIAALMKKSIAGLRKPKPGALPIRFLVLRTGNKVRLFLGPKPNAGLAKLMAQFPEGKPKVKIMDIKGEVVWEKAALTFNSDKLKVPVKLLQVAIKDQTKLNVKVRIKASDGSAEEADAPDLKDDDLKIDAADEAAALAAGKAFAKRLAELKKQIDEASKGPNGARIKDLVAKVTKAGNAQLFGEAAEQLDELESALEEGSVAEGDGSDDSPAAAADKNVAPAKALFAKLVAMKSKIDDAVKTGGDAAKQLKEYASAAEKLINTGIADNVNKANLFVNKIESVIAEQAKATVGLPSNDKLAAAFNDLASTRDTAVKEITALSKAIVAAFKSEASQASAVKSAVVKLSELQVKLKSTGIESDLQAVLAAKDAKTKLATAQKVRTSLLKFNKFVESDELMQNLDGNEIMSSMSVVAPLKSSLKAIEAALN